MSAPLILELGSQPSDLCTQINRVSDVCVGMCPGDDGSSPLGGWAVGSPLAWRNGVLSPALARVSCSAGWRPAGSRLAEVVLRAAEIAPHPAPLGEVPKPGPSGVFMVSVSVKLPGATVCLR